MCLVNPSRLEIKLGEYAVGSATALDDPLLVNVAQDYRRLTAQRLLVERGDRKVVADLKALAVKGKTPQARLHALYTLDGLSPLAPDVVEHALADKHFAVRVQIAASARTTSEEEPVGPFVGLAPVAASFRD